MAEAGLLPDFEIYWDYGCTRPCFLWLTRLAAVLRRCWNLRPIHSRGRCLGNKEDLGIAEIEAGPLSAWLWSHLDYEACVIFFGCIGFVSVS